jgi:hypothetical protein
MVGKTWQDHEKYGNFKNSQNCWFHEGNWGFNDGNWDFPSSWKSIVFLFRNDLQMVDMGMLNNGVFPAVTVIGKLAIQKIQNCSDECRWCFLTSDEQTPWRTNYVEPG